MNVKRPVNLDLTTMKFPITAIVSILHRLSGVALFLLLPFMLYVLDCSLRNVQSFAAMQEMLSGACWKLIFWIFGSALLCHLLAGIRHMIMDLGFGESLAAGRRTAWTVIVIFVLLMILLGMWICLVM